MLRLNYLFAFVIQDALDVLVLVWYAVVTYGIRPRLVKFVSDARLY